MPYWMDEWVDPNKGAKSESAMGFGRISDKYKLLSPSAQLLAKRLINSGTVTGVSTLKDRYSHGFYDPVSGLLQVSGNTPEAVTKILLHEATHSLPWGRPGKSKKMLDLLEQLGPMDKMSVEFPTHWKQGEMEGAEQVYRAGGDSDLARWAGKTLGSRTRRFEETLPLNTRASGVLTRREPGTYRFYDPDSLGEGLAYYLTEDRTSPLTKAERNTELGMWLYNYGVPSEEIEDLLSAYKTDSELKERINVLPKLNLTKLKPKKKLVPRP